MSEPAAHSAITQLIACGLPCSRSTAIMPRSEPVKMTVLVTPASRQRATARPNQDRVGTLWVAAPAVSDFNGGFSQTRARPAATPSPISTPVDPATGSTMTAAMVDAS